MKQALSIGVVGCGIGGMAAAIYCDRAGHDVTLIDRFDNPAAIGSGLVLQPVGLQVLSELGVAETVLGRGHKIYKMFGTESGTERGVLDVDYGPIDGEIFGLGIHRHSLFDALFQAVLAQGIKRVSGVTVCASDSAETKRSVYCENGDRVGVFDLVIDASGARSKLSPIKTRALLYGALWGTVDWPSDTSLPMGRLTQCYQQAHNMLGVLPIGNLPGETVPKAAIFWSEPRDQLDQWPNGDLLAWKDTAKSLWPEFAPFVDQITDASQMTPACYSHGTLGRPFGDRIVYIGDSAHQASPQLGQGANMALLDAQALITALEEYENMDLALAQYAAARRYHVWLYQIFSQVFTPFYQSDSQVLPILRNNVMNPLSRIWPVRPMLTRLVCGNLIQP